MDACHENRIDHQLALQHTSPAGSSATASWRGHTSPTRVLARTRAAALGVHTLRQVGPRIAAVCAHMQRGVGRGPGEVLCWLDVGVVAPAVNKAAVILHKPPQLPVVAVYHLLTGPSFSPVVKVQSPHPCALRPLAGLLEAGPGQPRLRQQPFWLPCQQRKTWLRASQRD